MNPEVTVAGLGPVLPAGWLRLSSPAIRRLVALELSIQFDRLGLPHELKQVVERAASDASAAAALPPVFEHLDVWIDTSSLHVLARHLDEKRWRQAALSYCVRRQAHYPLLKCLFEEVSRADVTKLRAELRAEPPPASRIELSDAAARRIWSTWDALRQEYASQIEQWVMLGQKFPEHALSSLYQFLVVESH